MIRIKNGEINETVDLLELLPEYKIIDNYGSPITYLIHKDGEYWSMQIVKSLHSNQMVVGNSGAPLLFIKNNEIISLSNETFDDLIKIRHKKSLRLRKIKRILDTTI